MECAFQFQTTNDERNCLTISNDITLPDVWLSINCTETFRSIPYVCEKSNKMPYIEKMRNNSYAATRLAVNYMCDIGWAYYNGHCILLQKYNYDIKTKIQVYSNMEIQGELINNIIVIIVEIYYG